ncbi:hypothetical protein RA273_29280, partial [Pseudomonas syringae pv. tagetis]
MTFGVLFEEDARQRTSLLGKLQGMYGTVNIPAITRPRVDDIGAAVVVSGFTQATFMTIGGVIP